MMLSLRRATSKDSTPNPAFYVNPAFQSKPEVKGDPKSDFPGDIQGPGWKEKPSKWSGYTSGICFCALGCLIVLIVNIALTAVGLRRYGSDSRGIGTISTGSCASTKKVNTGVHLFINAMSTVLLAATNYCMQCVNAPTRSQVDAAHEARRYVHIGVMRLGNLKWVGTKNKFLWVVLSLSSIPLHLLWNSAVFGSIGAYQYYRYTFPESQLDTFYNDKVPDEKDLFEKLDVEDCLRSYSVQLLTNRETLAIVTNNESSSLSGPEYAGVIDFLQHTQPFYYICWSFGIGENIYESLNLSGKPCTAEAVLQKYREIGSWDYGGEVQYCLSAKRPEICSLRFSKAIMVVVILCNAIKLGFMLFLLHAAYIDKEDPLITVGDAVASFMEQPDRHTRALGICAAEDIPKKWKHGSDSNDILGHPSTFDIPFDTSEMPIQRKRWYKAVGRKQFIISYLPPILGLLIAGVLLVVGCVALSKYNVAITVPQFGSVDIRALAMLNAYIFKHKYNLVSLALIANTPQLILSISYFLYNRLYTSMLLSYEYDSYSLHSKSLRVSRPRGYQRSNYFLSLPYRWSVPLMLASLILHWLFSQSFFLVSIDLLGVNDYSPELREQGFGIWDCGYSPMAIICSIAVSALLLVAGPVVAFGLRYKGNIPLAGSNSAAISTACHRPAGEDAGHLFNVQWGEVLETAGESVGHCSFTSRGIVSVRPGRQYI